MFQATWGRPCVRGTTRTCATGARPFRDHRRARGRAMVAEEPEWPPGTPRVREDERWSRKSRNGRRGPRVRDDPIAGGGTVSSGGRPRSPPCRGRPAGDHPRVRGDDLMEKVVHLAETGPSPRARGRHELAVLGLVLDGTTPRARGRLLRSLDEPCPRGATPACAGTTPPRRKRWCTRWDHPRVRGDDTPRVPRGPIPGRRCGDHPRVRGDDALDAGAVEAAVGPSPRARGRPSWRHPRGSERGTTPACAGTTTRTS